MQKRCFLLGIILLCLASCSLSGDKAAQASDYNSVATIKDIMDSMVDPSADFVWDSVGVEITAEGTVERAPKTDEEWKDERRRVVQLVEAANLLVMPERRVAKPGEKAENPEIELAPEEMESMIKETRKTFLRLAKEFQTTGIELLAATDKRDLEAISRLGAELDTRCENCHKTYWYPKDPVFKNDPKETDKDK
jgi:hypothetical protein